MHDTRTPAKRWALRVLVVLFYVGVAAMLFHIGRGLDWAEVVAAVRELPMSALALAAACSLATYLLYAGYELLAARHVGLRLPRAQVGAIGFVSYAFNLNLGAMLGALGVRLRLYTARGVAAGDGVRIVAFNLLTNWFGYLAVLGAALLLLWSEVPARWPLDGTWLRIIGAGLLALCGGYLWACARATKRSFTVRGQTIELPSLRHALLQLLLSVPVWLLTAGSLYVLLRAQAGFDLVAVTLLASAVAGLVVRVPAGLGVTEAVFLASLGATVGDSRLLATLLAFRCVHYLGPLLLGVAVFLFLELRGRSATASKRPPKPPLARPRPA